MKLANGILRPGTVLEVIENGCIKASVPGLFSSEDIDKLPPIRPFFYGSANSFSQPSKYDEVWVLSMSDNPLQLHWLRKDDYIEKNKEILQEENVEIICNRESGMSWATIYFSDGSGWVIKNDDSKIQIRKDGSIVMGMGWPHRTIDITPKSISLGSEGGSQHSAAYGDSIEAFLEDILSLFQTISTTAMMNPYTLAIGQSIINKLPKLQQNIGTISSPHVTLD